MLLPADFLLGACGLGGARHNLDLVGLDIVLSIVHLEGYVLELKCPDFITESICVETALRAEYLSASV